MFDFEHAPTTEESEQNRILRCEDSNPESRRVQMPASSHPRKSLNKPTTRIIKI